MKRTWFFADYISNLKSFCKGTKITKSLLFSALLVFSIISSIPQKVLAQQTDIEKVKAIYTPIFDACKQKLGTKLYDPAQKSDPEVAACLDAGVKASAGVTTVGDSGAVAKQTATSNANSLLNQYNTCIANAGSDVTKRTACEDIKVQADKASATAGAIITDTQKTNQALENSKVEAARVAALDPISPCTNLFTGGLFSCISSGVAWLITHTLLQFVGYFLWVSATLMNYSIQVGILRFSEWAPDALYPIWILVRQITSLFIVFAGLWLGFMYIINKGDKFKHYIPWVVIFALFVNFSYPLTRTIIDVSNIVSLNFYASAIGTDTLTASTLAIGKDQTAGGIIRDRLGLVSLIDFATGDSKVQGVEKGTLNSINSAPAALLAVLFIGYAAWIFFLVSALIITRTAVLIFLIIASPILFVDSVIPKLGDMAVTLRKMFFSQLAMGPVFTIMLAITLKFLEVFQASGVLNTANNLGTVTTGNEVSIVMFFNMAMMLIMLHIMLKVTKATSGKIGEAVSGVMGKVGGFAMGAAGGVALGGAGMLARGTMGRGAAALRDSKWVTNNQGNFIGRRVLDMSNSIAKSSFDGRNSSFVQAGAGRLGLSRGMGSGSKMGFEERAEAREKDRIARLGQIGIHKKNVYDNNGALVSKKGSIDTSEEAKKMREDYIKSVANDNSSVFAGKEANTQAKNNLTYKLEKAAGKETVSDEEKKLKDEERKQESLKTAKESVDATKALTEAVQRLNNSQPQQAVIPPTSPTTPTNPTTGTAGGQRLPSSPNQTTQARPTPTPAPAGATPSPSHMSNTDAFA
jgi:hypothetical protein